MTTNQTFTFTSNERHIIDQALAQYEQFLETKRCNLLKWDNKDNLYKDQMERTKEKLQVTGSLISKIPFEHFNYNQTKAGA
jgi:hypothetical protein